MQIRNVTLEISAKPFTDDSEQTMFEVGRKMFTQWKNLTDTADQISVILWIADGSEILDWSGDLDQTFEWGYWQGCAEPMPLPEKKNELLRRMQHYFPRKYREDAGPRTYRWLKRMIQVLRECCQEINGKRPRIVAIFDNGPEFCLSDFKYRRHNEICGGSTVGTRRSVICNSTLHGDNRKYAAYPEGIPEGLTLGQFFGAQFRLYAKEFGYDAIWLSNGMGFGREPWGINGFLFDGKQFHPGNAENARKTMLRFWEDFTSACPGIEIETRGSNFSAGVELASDGAPLAELYGKYKIAPPVNSPWAALNFNTGLEIAAWMSHIAELPDHRFPYRFYPHDPWFRNSPWLDRYGREPWDIYLPLAVSRIDENGKVCTPDSINLLTVDDSSGEMPDQVPQEVIPHLINAFRDAPDQPAPFVWVYPFRRYCEMVHGNDPHPEIVFNEDLFLGEVIQAGFPLNTVISLDNVRQLPIHSIAVVPVSAYGEWADDFLKRGGRIIFYGALLHAPDSLKKLLGLRCGESLTGRRSVTLHRKNDSFRHGDYAMEIYNHDVYNGGPLTEIADGADVIAEADGRVLASVNGNAAFLRSILPQGEVIPEGSRQLARQSPDIVFPVETLARNLARHFGWTLEYSAFRSDSRLPRMTIARRNNMFFFTVFARDTAAQIRIRTPFGVPVLDEMETEYTEHHAVWHPDKCWHKRCRIFIEQEEDTVFSQKIETAGDLSLIDRFSVNGLKDAAVRVFLDETVLSRLEFTRGPYRPAEPLIPYEIEETSSGRCATVRHVSGCLFIGVLKSEIK